MAQDAEHEDKKRKHRSQWLSAGRTGRMLYKVRRGWRSVPESARRWLVILLLVGLASALLTTVLQSQALDWGMSQLEFRVLAVLLMIALASTLVAALRGRQTWHGILANLGTELAGAVLTYVLLQSVVGTGLTQSQLIADLGSNVNDVAVQAANGLRRQGLLTDGTLRGANLSRANLSGANLGGADLTEAMLNEADLSGANLSEAKLNGADLSEADFGGADLRRAMLNEADLSWANFNLAILNRASLRGALLVGADLRKADLSGASLNGAVLPLADLSEADLSEADFGGANLQGANLRGADLSRADLSGASLRGANLYEADLSGPTWVEFSSPGLEDLREVARWSQHLGDAGQPSEMVVYVWDRGAAESGEGGGLSFSAGGAILQATDLFRAIVAPVQLSNASNLDGAILPDGQEYTPERLQAAVEAGGFVLPSEPAEPGAMGAE